MRPASARRRRATSAVRRALRCGVLRIGSMPPMARRARNDATARLLEAGRSLVAELDLEVVLERLLETARELTGARYAAIGVLDAERRALERFLTSGIDPADARGDRRPPARARDPRPADRGPAPAGAARRRRAPALLRLPRRAPADDDLPRRAAADPRRGLGQPLPHGEGGRRVRAERRRGDHRARRLGGDRDRPRAPVPALGRALRRSSSAPSRGSRRRRRSRGRSGSETDLARVLELVVKRGRALVRARIVVLLLEEGGRLVAADGAGQIGEEARAARRCRSRAPWRARCSQSGRPERIARRLGALRDRRRGARRARRRDRPARAAAVARALARRALRVRPARRRSPEFGDREEELLLLFAQSAATAVATARSVEAERLRHSLRSAEQERTRWARELHDETLQGLAALRCCSRAG